MTTSVLQRRTCARTGSDASGTDVQSTQEALFWKRVDCSNPDGCWPWIGYVLNSGYGCARLNGVTRTAHSVAFQLSTGVDPKGLVVCHRCDNPICCNPAHHFLGDAIDNAADAIAKGRKQRGVRKPRRELAETGRAPTERQIEVLRAIADLVSSNGYPPTLRELGDALGISSTNGVNDHIRSLRARGLLETAEHRSRSIRITDTGAAVLRAA